MKTKKSISEQNAGFDAKFQTQLQTLSLQLQEYNKIVTWTIYAQDNKTSSFTACYDECLKETSSGNKVRTEIETTETELE